MYFITFLVQFERCSYFYGITLEKLYKGPALYNNTRKLMVYSVWG